jgi:methylglyoxal synthase
MICIRKKIRPLREKGNGAGGFQAADSGERPLSIAFTCSKKLYLLRLGTVRQGGRITAEFFQMKGRVQMAHKKIAMAHDKKIALVAHDNKKKDLYEWAKFNRDLLAHHKLYATGTTGKILEEELEFEIAKLNSGPLGGDQQIGAKIADGDIDFLIFFWDPLEPQPHDPDVKALLRMAVVWNIPIACNRATADFMISSPLMDVDYDRLVPDYDVYRTRKIGGNE